MSVDPSRAPAFETSAEIPLLVASGNRPDQVGLVVASLENSLPLWGAFHGEQTWRIWTYSPDTVTEMTYHGIPAKYSMRLALAGSGPQIELIEPLEGPSIYHTWLDRHGPGLHHLGFVVEDARTASRDMEKAGFPVVQSGLGQGADDTGAYAYFDTIETLGFYLEAIEVPRQRREPESYW